MASGLDQAAIDERGSGKAKPLSLPNTIRAEGSRDKILSRLQDIVMSKAPGSRRMYQSIHGRGGAHR